MRGDQPDLMAKRLHLACLAMRAAISFEDNNAGALPGYEGYEPPELLACQLLAELHMPPHRGPVDMENALCQVHPDHRIPHFAVPFRFVAHGPQTHGTFDAGAKGGNHPICQATRQHADASVHRLISDLSGLVGRLAKRSQDHMRLPFAEVALRLASGGTKLVSGCTRCRGAPDMAGCVTVRWVVRLTPLAGRTVDDLLKVPLSLDVWQREADALVAVASEQTIAELERRRLAGVERLRTIADVENGAPGSDRLDGRREGA